LSPYPATALGPVHPASKLTGLRVAVSLEINWHESKANHFNPLSRLRLDGVSPPDLLARLYLNDMVVKHKTIQILGVTSPLRSSKVLKPCLSFWSSIFLLLRALSDYMGEVPVAPESPNMRKPLLKCRLLRVTDKF